MVLLSSVWGRFGCSARDQKRLAIPQLIFVAAFYFSGPPTRDISFSLKHHESQMENSIKKYKDSQGRTIEVISGIGGDTFFFAHHRHRIKSRFYLSGIPSKPPRMTLTRMPQRSGRLKFDKKTTCGALEWSLELCPLWLYEEGMKKKKHWANVLAMLGVVLIATAFFQDEKFWGFLCGGSSLYCSGKIADEWDAVCGSNSNGVDNCLRLDEGLDLNFAQGFLREALSFFSKHDHWEICTYVSECLK